MSKTGFEEDKFFDKYIKAKKKEGASIPGIAMNAPLMPRGQKGDIGLELEVEARNNLPRDAHTDSVRGKKTKAQWNAKQDGSLRGHAMEYVVSTPIDITELEPMVNGLFDSFKQAGTKLANSNRCSTHVHINIGGHTVDQLTAIIALWTTFEEVLINWCGEARVNNHYSLSSTNSVTMLEAWENFLRRGATRFPEGLKYSALNINTLWTFGSFEFRCGPAADTPVVPIQWARFLYFMCKYAMENYRNLWDLPRDLSELGGYQLFKNVCDTSGTSVFFDEVTKNYSSSEFNELCLAGFRNAQAIVLGFPWDRWSEEIRKEYVPQPFAKKKLTGQGIGINEWADAIPAPVPDAPGERREYRLIDIPREAHRRLARDRAAIAVREAQANHPDGVEMPPWEQQHIEAVAIDRFIRENRAALGIAPRVGEIVRQQRWRELNPAREQLDDNF